VVLNSIKKILTTLAVTAIFAASIDLQPIKAQSTTTVIAPSRTTDWSQAGVQGGIPTRNTICATLNPGATAGQINSAIASCPDGQVVALGAGTFNLSGSIGFNRNNVTLRGQGMSTVLNFTSLGGVTFTYANPAMIVVQNSGYSMAGGSAAPGHLGVIPSTVLSWVGTNGQSGVYTQGATVLNLSATPTGLAAGMTLTLWQSDAPDSTVPNNSYFVSAKSNNIDKNNVAAAGESQSMGAGQQQRVKVIAVNGTQVTVSPGIYRPTGWQTGVASGIGIENFRITHSIKALAVMAFIVAADSWVSGVGVGNAAGVGGDYVVLVEDSRNLTFRSNWIDPASGGGVFTTTTYGISLSQCSGCLVENNIFNGVEAPIVTNMGSTGCVIAYNLENWVSGEGGFQMHDLGSAMNLLEGNRFLKNSADNFHGNTMLNTIFRNNVFGGNGIDLMSSNRWHNLIGNVMNASVYKSIYSDSQVYNRFSGVAFRLGYADGGATGGVSMFFNGYVYPDAIVAPSTMIWGNYVTSVGATTWNNAEVPTSDALFPNPVPADHTLPASLYRSAAPSWWPSAKAWPPIGPDVTGGNVAGLGGHAYTLPAQDCFVSSGSLSNFVANSCYQTSGDTTPPVVTITLN
jgi:hypothetical protein